MYGKVAKNSVVLKLAHWNMLAQKLADNFDNMRENCPMIKIENRVRLMKQHIEQLGADVIGMSEVDGSGGEFNGAYVQLM